jgi:hypothetical protein
VAPDLTRTDRGTAAVRFLYPDHDLRLHSVKLGKPVSELTGLDTFAPLCQPDEELLLPPRGYMSRMAALVCHASTRESCLRALQEAVDEVLIESSDLRHEVSL